VAELFYLKYFKRNVIKIASIYLASIIGAGFASGQEIIQFFTNYGVNGFYGIALSGILFAFFGYLILEKVRIQKIKSFDELLFPLAGPVLGQVFKYILLLFLFSIYCIMVAGMGGILSRLFKLPFVSCLLMSGLLCMVIMIFDIEGIAKLSTVLAPLLVGGIVFASLLAIISSSVETSVEISSLEISKLSAVWQQLKEVTNNWIVSSILYVSYNNLLIVGVLSNMLPYLKKRSDAMGGGILGAFLIFLSAVTLNMAMFVNYERIMHSEFPMLDILKKYGSIITGIYNIILLFAMLTSAVNSGYSVIRSISEKFGINIRINTAVMCAISVPLSSIGFAKLISTAYPAFGYAGLFIMVLLLTGGIKKVGK